METVPNPTVSFNTAECDPRLLNLDSELPTRKTLRLLQFQNPKAYDRWIYFEAGELLENRHPHCALMVWSGSWRIPLGLIVNGYKVTRGRDGFLESEDSHEPVARYIRLYDNSDGEDPGQKMLILWSD